LDLADHVDASREAKENLVVRNVGGQTLSREREGIASIGIK
jgi:hypothetical protein